jgi:ABC-type sugar transport system ATPase subunit
MAVLRQGALEQVGRPLEVFDRPANTFVAGFVGSPAMNLLPCTCSSAAAGVSVTAKDAFALTVPGRAASGDAILGVRPQDVEIAGPDAMDGAGRVDVVEPLGSLVLLHVRVDGLAAEPLRVLAARERGVSVDDSVGLRFRRDRLHLFDGTTGDRLDA